MSWSSPTVLSTGQSQGSPRVIPVGQISTSIQVMLVVRVVLQAFLRAQGRRAEINICWSDSIVGQTQCASVHIYLLQLPLTTTPFMFSFR